LVALAAAGCASTDRQMARNETRSLFAETPTAATSHAYEVAGLTNITFGDRYVGSNALERAVDAYPKSVSARFNLATGYATTGRTREAAAIYQQLISDGQYTWMYARRDAFHPNANRHFNVADESARRLAEVSQRLTFAANGTTTGAISAAEAGTPVAAIVSAQRVDYAASDRRFKKM
jgi:predicted Zn-dependent protease